MIKGLALRLVSVSIFCGLVVAACSGQSGSGGTDAGSLRDGRAETALDAASDSTVADASGGADGPQVGAGPDGGGVCAPGAMRCQNNGVQACGASGQWGATMDCGQAACVDGACIGTCVPGATQCSGNGVQTCSASGAWGNATPCANQGCVAGACGGVCAPGATQCSGSGVQTAGPPASGRRRWRARATLAPRASAPGRAPPARSSARATRCRAAIRTGCSGRPSRARRRRASSGACAGACTPGLDAVLGQRRRDLRRHRRVGRGERVPLRVRVGGLHRRLHARRHPLLRRRRADLRRDRHLGQPPSRARTPRASRAPARASACRGRRSAPATACACAPRTARGAARPVSLRLRVGRLHRRVRSRIDAVLGNGVETCGDDRRHGARRSPAARAASPARAPGRARPGATQCSGNGVQDVRHHGHVGHGEPRARTRRASSGACTGSCVPAATQCSGNGVQTCDANGNWGAAVGLHDAGVRGGVVPGRLHAGRDAVLRQRRADVRQRTARWGAAVACGNQACVAGGCTGVCTPGATQCSGNGVQTCRDGTWGSAAPAQPGVRQRRVHGLVHARRDAVLGQRRADVRRDGQLGQRRGAAPARRASTARARARARRARRSARATACRRAASTGTLAAAAVACTTRRASGRVLGRRAPRAPRSARATASQTCSATGQWGSAVACTTRVRRPARAPASACPGATQCSGNGVQTCSVERPVGHGAGVHELRVRRRRLHRRVRARADAVLGQRRPDVHASGTWGTASRASNAACVAGACTGVCAPGATQCSGNGVETCGRRAVGPRGRVHDSACVSGGVHRRVRAGRDAVLGQRRRRPAASGTWGAGGRVLEPGCVVGRVHGASARPGRAVLGQRRRDVQRERAVGDGRRLHEQACVTGACTGSCTPGNVAVLGQQHARRAAARAPGAAPRPAPTRRA